MEVYLMYANTLDAYKIGVSKNSKTRLKNLQTGCPYQIELKEVFVSKYAYKVESALHRYFKTCKIDLNENALQGEWFNLNKVQVNDFGIHCSAIENSIDFLKKSGNIFIL